MRRLLFVFAATLLFAAACGSGTAQEACSPPTVSQEFNDCHSSGPGGGANFQTFALVTNHCGCNVKVTVHLEGGGAAVFVLARKPRNHK